MPALSALCELLVADMKGQLLLINVDGDLISVLDQRDRSAECSGLTVIAKLVFARFFGIAFGCFFLIFGRLINDGSTRI